MISIIHCSAITGFWCKTHKNRQSEPAVIFLPLLTSCKSTTTLFIIIKNERINSLTKILRLITAVGCLLMGLTGVVELGTKVCLEFVTGLMTSGVMDLFTGDSDLTELVVTLFFLFIILLEVLTEGQVEVLLGFLIIFGQSSGFISKRLFS
jgi:hypothetical protein